MLHTLSGCCFEENYKQILGKILSAGKPRTPRGLKTLELSPFIYECSEPLANKLTNKTRGINRAFSVAELVWILAGKEDVRFISYYNKNIAGFSDDGRVFYGAYGPRFTSQIQYVLKTLKDDSSSRQAIMTFWKQSPEKSRDIPCTVSLHFICQNDKLNLYIYMRSNDAWLGLPYDFYNFTMILNYISFLTKIPIGRYIHFAGSMHLYEQHYKSAEQVATEFTTVMDISRSKKITSDGLNRVINLEKRSRNGKRVRNEEINVLKEPWKEMAKTMLFYQIKKKK